MSAEPPFVLVTGNRDKRLEVERLLGCRLASADVDLPEIQSLDLRRVLEAKAHEAWQRLERPLVVEDTGLGLEALGGFPGPLVKWLLQAVGAAGIARLAHALDDPRARVRCALCYRDRRRTVVAEAEVAGRLTRVPRGERGFGWDPIFVPAGGRRTYAEMTPEEKDRVGHRGRAWRALESKLRAEGVLGLTGPPPDSERVSS